MAENTQKTGPTETVRIWKGAKKSLKEVIAEKTSKEKRQVTEAELLSPLVERMCKREKRKLGI